MAVSMEEFANELRAFTERREVVNEIRRDLRKPLPQLRAGGRVAGAAAARFTVRFKDSGRAAGVSIKVSRKSEQDKSDLDSIDVAGIVRHPLYGQRGHWYPQKVR